MNNQGGRTGQFNLNANIHTEVNRHLPIRPILPSSNNSLTIGSDERIPDRLSMPDLNLPYEENNSNIAPNNELELNISSSRSFTRNPQMFPDRLSGLNPHQYQGSTHNIPQSNIHSSAEDVRNNHDNNLNLSLSLSSHSPSGSRSEGMDSVLSANTRVLPSKRRYSDLGGELLIGESSRRGAELGAQQLAASSQANSSNNLTISSYRSQLASIHRSSDFEAAIGQRSVSNMQNQTQVATAPQVVTQSGGLQVSLPNQEYLFLQSGRSPFISSSGTANGATSSVQPLGYAPNFTEPQLASPHINIMSSRNNAPQNLCFTSVTTTPYFGNLPNHYEQRGSSSGNGNPSNNATGRVTLLNPPEPHMQVSSETGNVHSGAQEVDVSAARATARFETQTRDNRRITALLARTRADVRDTLMDGVRATQQFLDAAVQTIRADRTSYEHVIQILRNMPNLPAHVRAALDEQNEDVNTGLTEDQILKHIKREVFELVGEDTPENKEACTICQEDYVNLEEVGRLDCVHRFHINCIKQWLVLKNLCPICKKTALATDGDDAE